MFHDDWAGFSRYEEMTGTRINGAAIRFYTLEWSLSDIASFSVMFRGSHTETEWIRQKWDGFRRLLEGEASAPYGTA